MSQLIFPQYVLDDLENFISKNYHRSLPHPLIIAQAFCLRFKEYGTDFGVYSIANAVEYVSTRQIKLS
jgi:hypothetical protein